MADCGILLSITDGRFTEVCKYLLRTPKSSNRFIFKYGDNEIKAVRLFDQKNPMYDEHAELSKTMFEFVEVEDYNIDNYEEFLNSISADKRIIFSENSMPDAIWVLCRDGKRQLIYQR